MPISEIKKKINIITDLIKFNRKAELFKYITQDNSVIGYVFNIALKQENFAAAKLAISLGYDINDEITIHEPQGRISYLCSAVLNKNYNQVKFLLENGAHIELGHAEFAEYTPLFYAIRNDFDIMAELLIRNGATNLSIDHTPYVNNVQNNIQIKDRFTLTLQNLTDRTKLSSDLDLIASSYEHSKTWFLFIPEGINFTYFTSGKYQSLNETDYEKLKKTDPEEALIYTAPH